MSKKNGKHNSGAPGQETRPAETTEERGSENESGSASRSTEEGGDEKKDSGSASRSTAKGDEKKAPEKTPDKTRKYAAQRPFVFNGVRYKKGDVVELGERRATRMGAALVKPA